MQHQVAKEHDSSMHFQKRSQTCDSYIIFGAQHHIVSFGLYAMDLNHPPCVITVKARNSILCLTHLMIFTIWTRVIFEAG